MSRLAFSLRRTDTVRFAVALAAVSLLAPTASADLIVNFSGNAGGNAGTPSPNVAFSGNPPTSNSPFSFGTTFYSANAASGLPKFAGGYHMTFSGSTGPGVSRQVLYSKDTNPDELRLGINDNKSNFGQGTIDWQYLLMAQAADFATFTSGAVFDNTSSLSVNVTGVSDGNNAVNFVVQNGGTFYISTAHASSTGVFTLTDPGASTWAVLDTGADFGDIDANTLTGSTVTFDDVQAVGLFLQGQSIRGTGVNSPRIKVKSFVVNAASEVPEPGSLALMGLGALLVASRRRS